MNNGINPDFTVFPSDRGQAQLSQCDSVVHREQETIPGNSSAAVSLLSSEHARELAGMKNDYEFYTKIFGVIQENDDPIRLKRFLQESTITARLRTISGNGWKVSIIVDFLTNHSARCSEPLISKFVARELGRIYSSLVVSSVCKKKSRDYSRFDLKKVCQQTKLPNSIAVPLKLIREWDEDHTSYPLSSALSQKSSSNCSFFWFQPTRDTKLFAIEVANEIDGYDFRSGGIRLWFHQPRGNPSDAGKLILKNIQEFESRRRCFIFEGRNEPVPMQNYREVMRYIIRCLKEDRAAYYHQYPDYINPEIYAKSAEELEKKGFASFDFDERYPFEWFARKLVALEEKIEQAQTDEEICLCLEEFRNYYRNMPNPNMDLTVCSCIDYRGLHPTGHQKPILWHGVPESLIKLGMEVGVFGDFTKEQTLSTFNTLCSSVFRHPQSIQDTLERLRMIHLEIKHECLGNDNEECHPDLIKEFLTLWKTVPQNELLINNHDHGRSLQSFISELESQIGISEHRFKDLRRKTYDFRCSIDTDNDSDQFLVSCNGIYLKYRQFLNNKDWDAEKALTTLRELKVDVDALKALYPNEIKRKYWIPKYSQDLDKLLSKQKKRIYFERLVFKEVKNYAKVNILIPDTEISKKVDTFWSVILKADPNNLNDLVCMIDSLFDLKYLLLRTMDDPDFSWRSSESIKGALHQIAIFENGLAEEILKIAPANSPEAIFQLSRLAVSQGLITHEAGDLETLKRALETSKKESMLGFRDIRRNIVNTPSLLTLMEKQGMSVDEAVQAVQGTFNNGLASLLDRLFINTKNDEALSGMATQTVDVIGKIRFIKEGEDFSPAESGEILVIQNASPEVHKYASATAIISQQGGIFSHAAITFDELGIPALLGCDTDALKAFEGQIVHLHLADSSSLTPLNVEDAARIGRMDQLTAEVAAELEILPKEIRPIAGRQFYRRAFETLSVEEITSRFNQPLAKEHFAEEMESLKGLKKRLWKAKNPLQAAFYFNQLERKLTKLQRIALDWDPSKAAELENELIAIKRERANLPESHCPFVERRSGKKENLDSLREILPQISLEHLQLNVPAYLSWNAQELVWSQNPEIKQQISTILHSSQLNADKSQQIKELIFTLPIDKSILTKIDELNGELIVRSSARLEDQAHSTAAGIFESLRVQDRQEVEHAFRQVLTSSFSERALAFYASNDITDDQAIFDMDCIVQKYVSEGEYSGVGFSVVNAKQWDIASMQVVKGLGGGVDGTENPSYASVDTHDMTLADLRLRKGESLPCETMVVKEIGSLLKQLEMRYHCPVEIEFVGKGKCLSVVQVRPITKFND